MLGRRTANVTVTAEDHAARARELMDGRISVAKGGAEMRQLELLRANAHATLALYELLKPNSPVMSDDAA